ncbi:MAG: hypothetical protein ACJAY8_000971 [Sphingobacteriales bacterium]|jgi:hypothetical protein
MKRAWLWYLIIGLGVCVPQRIDAQEITRISEFPLIDGLANDPVWSQVPAFDNFTQNAPNPGAQPSQPSEIKMAYSDEGIYILALFSDSEPDQILKQLSPRDQIENSDHFQVVIDPFKGGVNAISFGVTASGVQIDKRIENGSEDLSWNAVWYSEVHIHDGGWNVEMFIPFFSFRFPDKQVQSWNINFFRQIRRVREESSWSFIDPNINGNLNQFKEVKGFNGIQSPLRIQLTPYLSGYYRSSDFAGNSKVQDYTVNGGLDAKIGLSDAFTLDMTLIPDFGQVQSDNKVLNLSPFEIQFDENRPFFQEGTQLFRKGGLFYSRRIGGTPGGYYDVQGKSDSMTVISNPDKARLLNASKVTGRTGGGLGVGIFNAVEGNTFAEYQDSLGQKITQKTGVAANYNILVLDQNLPNNGYITLTNANVLRDGSVEDANATGVQFRVANKSNSLSNFSMLRVTQQFKQDEIVRGFNYFTEFNKSGGNWSYGISHGIESDTYDPNDLGFLLANNEVFNGVNLGYRSFIPKGKFNFWNVNFNTNYGLLYKPSNFTSWNLNLNGVGVLKNFHAFGFRVDGSPVGGNDYFEPRKGGAVYSTPKNVGFNVWISSDYRKTFAIDISSGERYYEGIDQRNFFIRFSPRVRINDKLSTIYVLSRGVNKSEQGFAKITDDQAVLFGWRDNKFLTNVWTVNYIFTAKSSLSFRLRHHWASVKYLDFFRLNEGSGDLETVDYGNEYNLETADLNRNFNSFSVDLVYRWIFSPGSELNVVYKNNLDDDRSKLISGLQENFSEVWANPDSRIGSLSFRFVYFLDAGKLFRKI